MAMLSGAFGLLAALLAMLGLYGVISFTVARRRNEIGLRVALGADRRQVMLMVMREAGILLVIGLVIGAALSAVAGRGAGSLLFGLKPSDPLSLAVSVLLLSLVALFASYIPARRAAKVDPMVALRYE
jgi:ABC-type antimicrobial peptide transport system permease subunit